MSRFHRYCNNCCCCGSPPSAPRREHVPIVVRRFILISVVVQARPDIRVRVRRGVIRIRVRHTAIRIRVVVAAIDHTAYERFCRFQGAKVLIFGHILLKIFKIRRAYARILMSSCLGHNALSLRSRLALRVRFPALRTRDLDNRLERFHARRSHDLPSEGQARPDTRVRVRRGDIRIRERHTANRKRVVVAAIDHTAC